MELLLPLILKNNISSSQNSYHKSTLKNNDKTQLDKATFYH